MLAEKVGIFTAHWSPWLDDHTLDSQWVLLDILDSLPLDMVVTETHLTSQAGELTVSIA